MRFLTENADNAMDDIALRLRSHETEGVTSSDRFHLRNEAAAEIDRLRLAVKLASMEAKVFREAFDHISMHMQISESEHMAHMPLNEFIGHASVDDARYWDAE